MYFIFQHAVQHKIECCHLFLRNGYGTNEFNLYSLRQFLMLLLLTFVMHEHARSRMDVGSRQ